MIKIKRVYVKAEKSDGVRFLVERLWPRGIKKETLRLDAWLKDIAPSTALRKWFDHDPAKWQKFRQRYESELIQRPESWEPVAVAAKSGTVTLLFSSRDTMHNNAVALKAFLDTSSALSRKQ